MLIKKLAQFFIKLKRPLMGGVPHILRNTELSDVDRRSFGPHQSTLSPVAPYLTVLVEAGTFLYLKDYPHSL